MATKSTDAADEPPRRRGRRKLVLAALVLLVTGAAAVLMMGRGASSTAEEKPQPGAVVPLEHLTVNLADGHYLRVGLALQLAKGRTLEAGEEAGATPEAGGARALDAAITVFGGRGVDELDAAGRDRMKKQLLAALHERYEGAVLDVYFTEFVMQ